jgi:hypothetical protein
MTLFMRDLPGLSLNYLGCPIVPLIVSWSRSHASAPPPWVFIATDATFYLLLALFPSLTAFVLLYGFVADPATVADHVSHLGGLLPSAGIDIIRNQLEALASQDQQAGLVIALWSANNGAGVTWLCGARWGAVLDPVPPILMASVLFNS